MGVPHNILRKGSTTVLVILLIIPVHGLNLGLIAGDNKRLSSPLIIKKVSKLSPVFINFNGLRKTSKSLSPLPKLPSKPPPLKLSKPKSLKPKRSLLSPVPPLVLPPRIPPLPILPIIPPLLPLPLIPLLPIIPPLPILPPLLPIPKLKPLRVPILGNTPLCALHPKLIKPVNIKKDILAKLLDLKIKGSLTTPQFVRLKKLLGKC